MEGCRAEVLPATTSQTEGGHHAERPWTGQATRVRLDTRAGSGVFCVLREEEELMKTKTKVTAGSPYNNYLDFITK